MEADEVVQSLASLAHATRLTIFRMLVTAGEAGARPATLAEALGIPSNTLSFHLKELLTSQLVTQERQGRTLVYRARYPRFNALLGYLTDNCCQGQDCGIDTTRSHKKPQRRRKSS